MSHSPVREDKTCLNCGSRVEILYCPQCGQQNTITRQPFYYLITHFVEDFLHYDGGFLNTMKRLFFRPGQLTVDYLAGRRNDQVNPVKLYIFVSFVTFFIMSLVPVSPAKSSRKNTFEDPVAAQRFIDSLKQDPEIAEGLKDFDLSKKVKSATLSNQDSAKHPFFLRPLVKKKANILTERGWTTDEVKTAFVAKYIYYFPKVLFLYLPIFAFFLWLFYDKRKFWYFDQGIFTLHYLTMSLTSISLIYLLSSLQGLASNLPFVQNMLSYVKIALGINILLNFYLALYRCYKQSVGKTILKGTIVMGINTVVLFLTMIGVIVLTFINL